MNSAPVWLQDFVLNLNGNEIFWAPILMIGVGLLFLWVLPSIKGSFFTVLGWLLFALMGGTAAFVWSHVWDWRADQYSAEIVEEVAGVELMGTLIEDGDIRSDQYGVGTVRLDLDYEFGFSEVYAVSDVEDLIDYMVINYKLENESGTTNSYLHDMREFQQLRIELNSEESEEAVDDILAYERNTLREYANSVSLRDPDSGFFWSDSDQTNESEVSGVIDDTGYRVIRNDLSPWDIRDERASDGGVTEGQWMILSEAPAALETVNNASCGVFNGFNPCDDDESQPYHSIVLAFILLISIIIGAVIIEAIIRRGENKRHKKQMVATAEDIEQKLSKPSRHSAQRVEPGAKDRQQD